MPRRGVGGGGGGGGGGERQQGRQAGRQGRGREGGREGGGEKGLVAMGGGNRGLRGCNNQPYYVTLIRFNSTRLALFNPVEIQS